MNKDETIEAINQLFDDESVKKVLFMDILDIIPDDVQIVIGQNQEMIFHVQGKAGICYFGIWETEAKCFAWLNTGEAFEVDIDENIKARIKEIVEWLKGESKHGWRKHQ